MEGGPPVFRVDSSCPHVLRIPPDIVSFAYRILTFSDRPSHAVQLAYRLFPRSLPRKRFRPRFGLPALSLAATHAISVDYSSCPYLDVSLQGVPLMTLCIHVMIRDSSSRWFPNSDTSGSMLMYSSPELFAVSRVLRRLLMPRHSPYALLSLNFAIARADLPPIFTVFASAKTLLSALSAFTISRVSLASRFFFG